MPAPIQTGTEAGAYARTVTASLSTAPAVGNTVFGIGSYKTDSDPGPSLVSVSDNQGGVNADYDQQALSSLQRSGVFIVRRVITAPVVGTFSMELDIGAGYDSPNVRLQLVELPGAYHLAQQSSDASGQFDGGSETINLTALGANPAGELIAFAAMTPRADGNITSVANNPPTGWTQLANRFTDPAPLVSAYKSISAPETTSADFGAVGWNGGRLGAKLLVYVKTPVVLSVVALTPNQTASPGAQSVTVPDGATHAAFFWQRFNGSVTSELTGVTSTFGDFTGNTTQYASGADIDSVGVAWCAVTGGAGSRTITPVWASNANAGPECFLAFLKDVDSTSPVMGADAIALATTGVAASRTVTSAASARVLALDTAYEVVPSNPAGWLSLATQNVSNLGARLRSANTPGDSTTTATSQTTDYPGMVLIAFRVATSGGGGDFNATQTESSAGADTTNRSLVASSSQTESSAGADSTNRTMVTTRAQTESAAGADSQSAVRSLGGQMTESAAGADSQSAVVTSSRQQTESAAGADSTNRTMAATPVMAESSAGADSQQRTLSIGAAQLETAAGADTQTQATAKSASQVEAGEGTDSSNGFIAGTIAQVESAEATDTQGRSMVATRAQTESSAGVDTQTGARLTLAAITEACAGVDAAWAVLVAVRAMNEVASGADTVLGFQNTGTAMFEACSPADAVASALVATGAQVEVQVATDAQQASMLALAQALESAAGLDTITGSGGGSTYVVHQDEHGHAVDVTVVMAPPEPGGKYVVRKTRIGYRVVGGDRRFIIYRR